MKKNPDSIAPDHIGPSEDGKSLVIRWKDDHESVYDPRFLRLNCPCAGCVDEMSGQKILEDGGVSEDVRILEIHTVGNYAISIKWSDGHDTGIYAFERLRRLL